MLSIARIRQNIDKTLLFLAATVALALAIRVIYVSLAPYVDPVLAQNPLYGDAQGYHLLALNLLNGYGLSWDGQQPTSYRAPGYPAFLALMYCFTGSNLAIVRIIQAVLGALTCIPVFLLAKQLAGPATAAISGFAVAFHPLLVYMTAWLYPETLFILLLWLALWTFSHSVAPHTSWHALFSGGLLGLAALIRPEVVALPLFCAIPLLGFRKQRHLLRQLLIVEAIAILVVLPWSIRNMAVHRAFVLITTNTGSNLYGGNNPDADGGFTSDVPYILPRMTEVESDHELIQRAVQWIIHHPGDFISLLPQKFAKFFSPLAMGTSEDIHLSGNLVFWVNVLYTLYLLLALGGAILLGIYQSKALLWLIAPIAYFTCIALIFFGGTRFSLPIAPSLCIIVAYGLVWGANRIMRISRS